MSIKIGNLQFKNGVFLAPMAGVSDYSFRLLCREYGAELTFTEMVSAAAIHYNDKKTLTLANIADSERPIGIQLFGHEPQYMREAAAFIAKRFSPDIIDINMGCPVKKIVNNGEGSALMRNPSLAAEIMNAVREGADGIPVTVKIRAGWDDTSINAVEIARIARECGMSAVTVHGRTREQMYTPPVNYDIIKRVKASIDIPVIGNGGIMSPEDALQMLNYTSCDAVMVARGARGNPWIFNSIISSLNNAAPVVISDSEKINLACRHLDMLCHEKGDFVGVRESRAHIAFYIKGMKNAAYIKNAINYTEDSQEVKNLLQSLI